MTNNTAILTVAIVSTLAGTALGQQIAAAPESSELLAPTAAPAAAPAAEEAAGPNTGRLHFSMGVDVTNAYFFRGIRQEDDGIIVQPYAGLTIDGFKGNNWALAFNLGTWNSFHDKGTGTANDDFSDKWYESDIILGATLTTGKWTLAATYTWLTNPSDILPTVQQIDVTAAYDDTEALGAWALHPTATVTFETDNASDGQDEGKYLQLGIAPGFSRQFGGNDIAFSFPLTVGLSLGDYYQDAAGEDDTFGYASLGAKAAIPLPVAKDFGAWTLNASVTGLLLGDNTKIFNEDDESELIVSVGLSATY
ncbi:MAG: hypothetical protein U0640_02525 [Phycisphaerales bacterium]